MVKTFLPGVLIFLLGVGRAFGQIPITVKYVEHLTYDSSFTELWDYAENVFVNDQGELVCDWSCPPRLDKMRGLDGSIIRDSLEVYYQLFDTSHFFHNIKCATNAPAFSECNYVSIEQTGILSFTGFTAVSAATHTSLMFDVRGSTAQAKVYFNDIRGPAQLFKLESGSIEIDESDLYRGWFTARFSMFFKRPGYDNIEWFGVMHAKTHSVE